MKNILSQQLVGSHLAYTGHNVPCLIVSNLGTFVVGHLAALGVKSSSQSVLYRSKVMIIGGRLDCDPSSSSSYSSRPTGPKQH